VPPLCKADAAAMNHSKTTGSAAGLHPGPATKSAPASGASAGTAVKSGAASGGARSSGVPPAAPVKASPSSAQPEPRTGQVVHDDRGNAVWDWLKQTGRNAIESTTRMLRKLESPELKVEQTHEEELRIQPDGDSCAGGGYDPYNQPIKSRRTPGK
jgi:hypothetical protein